jgi:RNA polymerase sigma-70 factor (ECF subfamily)
MADPKTKGNSMSALSDNVLLQQMRGDTASFETLFYRHYDRVYGLLFRLLGNRAEAEDVTQEVFLQLYMKPPGKRLEQNVSAWLYRVATNKGYNHIRGQNRLWQRNRVLVPDVTEDSPDPADVVSQEETITAVRKALARLPQRQTQMLLLRQMGLSYIELAEICNVKPGSVGNLLARAGQAFREAYQKEEKG